MEKIRIFFCGNKILKMSFDTYGRIDEVYCHVPLTNVLQDIVVEYVGNDTGKAFSMELPFPPDRILTVIGNAIYWQHDMHLYRNDQFMNIKLMFDVIKMSHIRDNIFVFISESSFRVQDIVSKHIYYHSDGTYALVHNNLVYYVRFREVYSYDVTTEKCDIVPNTYGTNRITKLYDTVIVVSDKGRIQRLGDWKKEPTTYLAECTYAGIDYTVGYKWLLVGSCVYDLPMVLHAHVYGPFLALQCVSGNYVYDMKHKTLVLMNDRYQQHDFGVYEIYDNRVDVYR